MRSGLESRLFSGRPHAEERRGRVSKHSHITRVARFVHLCGDVREEVGRGRAVGVALVVGDVGDGGGDLGRDLTDARQRRVEPRPF
jgi:hypothetical protein